MSKDVQGTKLHNFDKKKGELITGLLEVRERLLTLASSLSERNQGVVFLGTWSARELLAHLAGWDKTNLLAAKGIVAGQLPDFYDHYDEDWATYNAMLVAQYMQDDFEALLATVRETHGELIAFISDLPSNELWKDRGIRVRGWRVTIGRILEVEREDEEEHCRQLKQFIDSGTKS